MFTKRAWIIDASEMGWEHQYRSQEPRKRVYLTWGRREIQWRTVGTYRMIHYIIDTANLVHTRNALERGR